jgi:hypothetical protein
MDGNLDSMASTNVQPAPLWTEQSAARFLNLSVSTLRAWRLRRVGAPFLKISTLVRYSPEAVAKWACEQARPIGGAR